MMSREMTEMAETVSTRARTAPRFAGLAAASCMVIASAIGLAGAAAATWFCEEFDAGEQAPSAARPKPAKIRPSLTTPSPRCFQA